jgi:cysteine desulfurase
MHPIYLDHNATTPLLPEAWDAMQAATDRAFGNPSSAHHAGRAARKALEDARERVAAGLGASPDEITFTSGATEANNLAVFGLVGPVGGHILSSPLEHPCVVEPLRQLELRGCAVEWLPVSARGIVPVESVAPRIRPDTRLVSIMLVNHETGAMQPVRDIVAAVSPQIPVHTDAAQAVGKMPVDFRRLGVAALTASAHKFRGPKGIGVLILKRGVHFRPLMFGGHQQHGRRPGTEPVPLAVGMATALEHAIANMAANRARLESLCQRFRERVAAVAAPVVWNGPGFGSPEHLPTTFNVSFPDCRVDRVGVFEWFAAAQPGPSSNGCTRRSVAVRDPIQFRPDTRRCRY